MSVNFSQFRSVQICFAQVNADGTAAKAANCEVTKKPGTGEYKLVTNQAVPDARLMFSVGCSGAGAARIANLVSVSNLEKTISIYSDSGSPIDSAFEVRLGVVTP